MSGTIGPGAGEKDIEGRTGTKSRDSGRRGGIFFRHLKAVLSKRPAVGYGRGLKKEKTYGGGKNFQKKRSRGGKRRGRLQIWILG